MSRSPRRDARRSWWQRLRDWAFGPPRPAAGESRGILTRWLGDAGERLAARHLRRLGMRILFRQYRTPAGEIDLIAQQGKTVVFVEVKTRRGVSAGLPAEAVDHRKQAQLTRLALAFLKRHRLLDHPARFDVVAIVWPAPGSPPVVTHYPNAFEAVGHGQMFS